MSHLDIQKGKEAMNTSKFQKYLIGTVLCTERLAIASKGCGQLTSNDSYFDDSWFSSAKMAEEAMAAGVDYCRTAKTTKKSFCQATLEKPTKDMTLPANL